ncbi:MAG: hypothetical protein K2I53_08550, partial [Lachnospiraceae bacterium]|nr:hypothetical protein [Lachnospiraceae bacterium]
ICLDRTRGRKALTQIPGWLKSVIDGRGSVRLSVLLNYLQTEVYLGMLLYLFLRWRKGNLYELIGAVIFLGGYLFHLFWESSASYTIPYFVLLIPYAVCGMAEWAAFLEREVRLRRIGRNGVAALGALLALCLVVFAFTRTNLFDRTIALDDDKQGIDASAQFYQTGIWEKPY